MIIIFGFSNVKTIRMILNFNRQRKKIADQCYSFTSSIVVRSIGAKRLRRTVHISMTIRAKPWKKTEEKIASVLTFMTGKSVVIRIKIK